MDLHIIGAGPAGTIAAISAIRSRNANVLISEEHASAGVPTHCSGLFSLDGLKTLKEFMDWKPLVKNRMNGATLDFAGEKLRIATGMDVAAVCDRAGLDERLAERAEAEGAEIDYGVRIGKESQFQAPSIIGADGPTSFVANHFGFPKIKSYVNTLQAVLPYEAADCRKVELFFSNAKFPGFFGWVIPHDEETAEFGCGAMLPHNANKAWLALLSLNGMRRTPMPTGAVIPISVRKRTAATCGKRTVILVGDAAGQVKATTGGGVIFGGNCAQVAGRHYDSPLRYELGWKRRYLPDLLAHRMVHDYLAGKNDAQLARLGKRLREAGAEEFLSRKGHMDKPSKMLGLETVRLILNGLF